MNRKFLPAAVARDASLGAREIRVVASDATPDRAGDVMIAKGCDFSRYAGNPIVLADHDPTKPIGTAEIAVVDDKVVALVTFAPAGVSAKADEYCGLAKAGVLNAVSVGFSPIAAEPIKGGGFRYEKWELMELSMVAVPCNPSATVIARSAAGAAGRATKAEEAWKCGASRNLPLGPDAAWDGPSAEKSVFDHCGFDGDKPDYAFARKAFLAYNSAKPDEKGSYKEPFAQIVDGRLTAMPAGIRAAASRLPQSDIPADVADKARAVIDEYEGKLKDKSGAALVKSGFVVKGLADVASLAWLLRQLGWAHADACAEALAEGDGSQVPEMLATALRALAEAFLAMSAEETRELLAAGGLDVDVDSDDPGESALGGEIVSLAWAKLERKSGAVLSAANRGHLAKIKTCLDKMAACHVKAADCKDEIHECLAELAGHIDAATTSAKALGKTKPKPDDDGADDDGESDTDDSNPDSAEPNVELAAAAARRRALDLLAAAAA